MMVMGLCEEVYHNPTATTNYRPASVLMRWTEWANFAWWDFSIQLCFTLVTLRRSHIDIVECEKIYQLRIVRHLSLRALNSIGLD